MSTTETVFALRQLQEKYREKNNDYTWSLWTQKGHSIEYQEIWSGGASERKECQKSMFRLNLINDFVLLRFRVRALDDLSAIEVILVLLLLNDMYRSSKTQVVTQ